MARQHRAANHCTALLTAVAVLMASTTPTVVSTVPNTWTSRSSQDAGARCSRRASADDSHRRLEEKASRETREIFGEDFCRQVEEEREAVRVVHDLKARVGREAGCHPTSPLSSSALIGPDAATGDQPAEGEGGGVQNGTGGPMADWLR